MKQLPDVTPAGTRRLELEVASPTARLSELRQLNGIVDATLFGQTIHLLAANDLSETDLLRQLNVSPGEAMVRPIAPSLEDVFVTLTRAAEEREMSGELQREGEAPAKPLPNADIACDSSSLSPDAGEREQDKQ